MAGIKLLFCADLDPAEAATWRHHLAAALPEADWLDADAAHAAPAAACAAVVANPRPGALAGLPGLGFVQSLWAGVDRLLADPTLPPDVPVARMVDPAMSAAMAETTLWAALSLHRGFFAYQRRQRERRWHVHAQRRADEIGVVVLGGGAMGQAAASRLVAQGYRVGVWSRSGARPPPAGAEGLAGDDGLARLLPRADVLVNLLPLTPATRGLLGARRLAALPPGAGLVNLGRGAHLVEADLLDALDRGTLGHAVLDVFETEPLPAGHPFWTHPRITVLPHAAALTDPRSAASVAAANLRAWHAGRPIEHLVDRARGY
jgi:glyoxylate/hydroxypyruvate reductase A